MIIAKFVNKQVSAFRKLDWLAQLVKRWTCNS